MSRTRFEGVILADSAKAIYFQSHYWDDATWLPKSQIVMYEDGDFFWVVEVNDWLANKNGLLEFSHYSAEQMEKINGAR